MRVTSDGIFFHVGCGRAFDGNYLSGTYIYDSLKGTFECDRCHRSEYFTPYQKAIAKLVWKASR
jgi:hypothetical protein